MLNYHQKHSLLFLKINMKEVEIYIHIPFCERKCLYCNFVSYCVKENIITQYIEKLKNELMAKLSKKMCVKTLFFGGGTPSLINANYILELINLIKQVAVFDKDCEVTIECNPNSTTREKLELYLKCGINRISFGAQTFNDKILKSIGRLHNSNQINNAVNLARDVGFKNISLDLMVGLCGQTLSDVENDVNKALCLGVDHISCYSLILEEGTPLCRLVNSGKVCLPDDDLVVEMYDKVNYLLNKNGLPKYEVSSFAKPGFECRHNIGYWTNKEYIGFGVAAHSFIDGYRKENTEDIQEYLSKSFDEIENSELLSQEEEIEEYIMLSLRTSKGLYLEYLKQNFNYDLLLAKKSEIDEMVRMKLIKLDNNFISATEEGFHILNKIILKLV